MNKIRVIDLLNKIANGEIIELHKFKWNEKIWEEYSKFEKINNEKSYREYRQNGISFMRFENVCDARHFNDEIEIIEEDKKIEKINIPEIDDIKNARIVRIEHKINEIINEVNKLKGENE